MARSLLRQLEQIRRSATYNDAVASPYTSAVAEPTVSGSLEQDLNVVRTLVKEMKGTTDWFGDLGNYFDPKNTTSGTTETKDLNLSNIKNKTLDSKTALLAIADDNNEAGHAVVSGTTGVLITTTTKYATPDNRTGLPIFASTANAGAYWDEGAGDRTVRVDVLDADGNEFQTVAGHTVYAKLQDAADHSGTGDGTDVFAKFYANDAVVDLTSILGGPPATVTIVYPYRKTLDDVLEHEWTRTTFVSSWEGDVELVEDIQNIWAFTGATDNDGSAGPWDHALSGNYALTGAAESTSLKAAIELLDTDIGDKTYATGTYITSGEPSSDSIEALDTQVAANASWISGYTPFDPGTIVQDVSNLQDAVGTSLTASGIDFSTQFYVTDSTDLITAIGALDTALNSVSGGLTASSVEKQVESMASLLGANTAHTLPNAITYTPVATAGQEGGNMDVFVDGQLLSADTGAAGVNGDRDYAETSTTSVTFHFPIQAGRNVTYMIRQ